MTLTCPTEYQCTSQQPTNLIINGNFENGNNGVTSTYSYDNLSACTNPNSLRPHIGSYSIVENPHACHRAWDVMSGNNMIIFNGYEDDRFWCQTVAVSPNTNYFFSVKEKILHPDYGMNSSNGSSPLRWTFNGTTILTTSNAPRAWRTRTASWYSNANTSLTICGINESSNDSGNDWAIDDICLNEFYGATHKTALAVVLLFVPALPSSRYTAQALAVFPERLVADQK